MIKLIKGDCLEKMKEIESGSIDLILTDPPYGTTACKWDSVIPFEPMWERLNKLIRPNGAIVLFGSEPFSSALRMSNINNYKYDWVWEKSKKTGFTNSKNRPLSQNENIIVFSLGNVANGSKTMMNYYPQNLKKIDKLRKGDKNKSIGDENGQKYYRPSQSKDYIQEFTNYPTTILKFPNEGKTVHPTQKPVALLEYLIKTYTLENETVLDFTAGSFSTAIACINTNRKFIGIEKDDNYFNIGQQRVQKHLDDNR